jgi:putative thioredoxin
MPATTDSGRSGTVDFDTAVLARSREVPVVVDFWAPWCGPCRVLGPIIEDLAAQAGGRWELVKLDTEAQPEIAMAYGIRSIPNVKLFRGGKVVAGFVGALPASDIRRWLDDHIPDEGIENLDKLAARWPREGGVITGEIEALAKARPELGRAKLRLAQAIAARDPARARSLIAAASLGPEDAELQADVTALLDLVERTRDVPPKLAPHLEAAQRAFREHDLDATLEHLVDVAMRDKSFGDELARRAAVALFRILGRDHELTDKYQRLLSMAVNS